MKLDYANPLNRDEDQTSVSSKASQFFAAYFWFILKNVIGWLLVLGSPVLGVLIPGPGGLPLFLIGFALITLPGKRRLTARALRGRQLQLQSSVFYAIGTVVSLLVPLTYIFYPTLPDPVWWQRYRAVIMGGTLGGSAWIGKAEGLLRRQKECCSAARNNITR